jgi:hypothetical protein
MGFPDLDKHPNLLDDEKPPPSDSEFYPAFPTANLTFAKRRD